MPEATVLRTFDLVRHDGTEQRFQPGKVNFTDADFEHWQVQGNIVGGNTLPPKPGSYEYHELHPSIQNITNLMKDHATREAQAVAEENALITEQRSKTAAERAKVYMEELNQASKTSSEELLAKQQRFQSVFSTQAQEGYKAGGLPASAAVTTPTEPSEQETVTPKNGRKASAEASGK